MMPSPTIIEIMQKYVLFSPKKLSGFVLINIEYEEVPVNQRKFLVIPAVDEYRNTV
jgi:hypothetical protein